MDDAYGTLSYVGGGGCYWSVTSEDKYGSYFSFHDDDEYYYNVSTNGGLTLATGLSVRCLKISEINGDNEGFGGSDYEW